MPSWLLAALSGALYFLGFAGFDLWPLSFVALVPLLWVLDPAVAEPKSELRLVGLGLMTGLVLHIGGYYWIVGTLETFSGFPFALCVLLALLLWAAQGGMIALFAWAFVRLRRAQVPSALAAALSMCAAEFAYPRLFEHYFANSLHALPLAIQTADLGGTLLVTALLCAANAALFQLSLWVMGRRRAPREIAAVAAAWALALGYGAYRIDEVETRAKAADKLVVGLVQTNMGLMSKRDDPLEGLKRHVAQSRKLEQKTKLDLLVWPESAFGWFIGDDDDRVDTLIPMGTIIEAPLLFGGLAKHDVGGRPRPFNTAFLVDADGKILGSYDKTYLLAFGEYIPFGERFPELYEMSPNTGRFVPGSHVRSLRLGDVRLGALICYEDILPAFVLRMMREDEPHLLVNVTNDAWFGDTTQPWQHLALAKFRSVEHHRAMVRSTNSGVSAFIDPVGRVISHTGVMTREELAAELPLLEGTSVYARIGDALAWLSLLAVALAWWRGFRTRLEHRSPR